MAFELDEAASSEQAAPPAARPSRNRVHVGSKEFDHLKEWDMNALCARVVVTGVKPGG